MNRDVLILTHVSLYTELREKEPSLPGPRLATPLRIFCGPELSFKIQGLPVKQGQSNLGRESPSQKNMCEIQIINLCFQ